MHLQNLLPFGKYFLHFLPAKKKNLPKGHILCKGRRISSPLPEPSAVFGHPGMTAIRQGPIAA